MSKKQNPPPCVSVLRVGGPCPNISELFMNSLLGHFHSISNIDGSSYSSNGNNNTCETIPEFNNRLTITNKYFSASIQLSQLSLDHINNDSLEVNNDTTTPGTTPCFKEDGVVLVFDALQCNPDLEHSNVSFHSLELIHESHCAVPVTVSDATTCNYKSIDNNSMDNSISSATTTNSTVLVGDLLRLVVGVTLGSCTPLQLRGKLHEEEYSKRILWCLDRGYEYVEVDLSPEGLATGHDERDKEGFARVVEAIQGTVWSSAVRIQNSNNNNNNNNNNKCKNTEEKQPQQEHEINPSGGYEPPDPLPEASFLLDKEPKNPLVDEYMDEPQTVEEAKLRASHLKEAQAFEELEGIMKEANRIRDMSRNRELSDDQRRERAAEAATLMMGLLEKMGMDESGSEEDSDS